MMTSTTTQIAMAPIAKARRILCQRVGAGRGGGAGLAGVSLDRRCLLMET
jgi:hypothetical protein